jgi:hypothetical protein
MTRGFRLLKLATTEYLVVTVALSLILVVAGLIAVLGFGIVDRDVLSTFLDLLIKAGAMIGAVAWGLNRYFMGRTDIPQLRVEPFLSTIPPERFPRKSSACSLLLYRLDIMNTGKTLITPKGEFVEIHAIVPEAGGDFKAEPLYRWPREGYREGNPIEPGSWSAISDMVALSRDIQAIRLYVEIAITDESKWTWHRIFDLYPER